MSWHPHLLSAHNITPLAHCRHLRLQLQLPQVCLQHHFAASRRHIPFHSLMERRNNMPVMWAAAAALRVRSAACTRLALPLWHPHPLAWSHHHGAQHDVPSARAPLPLKLLALSSSPPPL
jgi:hypothetical protein